MDPVVDAGRPPRASSERWPLASVLIVDDEPGMGHFLQRTIVPRVNQVLVADSAEPPTR